MVGGVLLALGVCLLIQPAEELVVDSEPETAVARLLVARSADLAVEVFEYTPEEERSYETIMAACNSLTIPVLDLRPNFESASDGRLQSLLMEDSDYVHFNWEKCYSKVLPEISAFIMENSCA